MAARLVPLLHFSSLKIIDAVWVCANASNDVAELRQHLQVGRIESAPALVVRLVTLPAAWMVLSLPRVREPIHPAPGFTGSSAPDQRAMAIIRAADVVLPGIHLSPCP
ncbi:hypothetical protein MTO96_032071 [Rhipicephalus appendiculatus]